MPPTDEELNFRLLAALLVFFLVLALAKGEALLEFLTQ